MNFIPPAAFPVRELGECGGLALQVPLDGGLRAQLHEGAVDAGGHQVHDRERIASHGGGSPGARPSMWRE